VSAGADWVLGTDRPWCEVRVEGPCTTPHAVWICGLQTCKAMGVTATVPSQR
jgi:hypothetical protein